MATAKEADLAGPGIGSYEELDRILPADYTPLLEPRETMEALYAQGASRRGERQRLARGAQRDVRSP